MRDQGPEPKCSQCGHPIARKDDPSSAKSFKTFLTPFKEFNGDDKGSFFGNVRCGLLHDGEVRGNWKVRFGKLALLTKTEKPRVRTINRRLFHARVLVELRRYCRELEDASAAETRRKFLKRMDILCQVEAEAIA